MNHECALLSDEENIQILNGQINFDERVISNLRQQIRNLRTGLNGVGVPNGLIDELQYAHLNLSGVSGVEQPVGTEHMPYPE